MKSTKHPIQVAIHASWDSNGKDRTRIVIEGVVDTDLLGEVEYHRNARPEQTQYLDPANEKDAKRIKALMRKVDPATWNETQLTLDIPGEGFVRISPLASAEYGTMRLALDVEGWNMNTSVTVTKNEWSMRDGKLYLKMVAHRQ